MIEKLYDFEDVSERDIDMALISAMGNNKEMLKYILYQSKEYSEGKIKIVEPKVVKIIHSHVEPGYGESDIVVIYVDCGKRYGLFIEDKINARAMDKQADRYLVRAEIAKKRGDFEAYCIFIVAPQKYIDDKNPEAEVHKYPNKLSYERIMKNVELSPFQVQLMSDATSKQRTNYSVVRDDDITKAWNSYKQYADKYYPDLEMYDFKPVRGAGSTWMKFITWIDGTVIYHKTNPSKLTHGTIELNFKVKPHNITLLEKCLKENVGDFYARGYQLKPCGKSEISLVRKVPQLNLRELDLEDDINGQINILETCLQEVRQINDEIVKKLAENKAAIESKIIEWKK